LVGWMPDHLGTYASMTVFEYLDFFARAYGLDAARRRDRVEEVMSFADLDILADRQMAKLSKGMSQRLCFGRMLIPDPEFMILDEPAAGLDPKARLEFKNLVRILANRGKTLLISSHILSELGEMCDHIVFIDKGRMVFEGRADELRNGATAEGTATDVEVTVAGGTGALRDWIGTPAGVVDRRRAAPGSARPLSCDRRGRPGGNAAAIGDRRDRRGRVPARAAPARGGVRRLGQAARVRSR